MGVICDYLSVTYGLHWNPAPQVRLFLTSLGAVAAGEGLYRLGERGTVTVGLKYGTMRVSASGSALAAMRDADAYMAFLSLLGEHPHRVTLLDAALDIDRDAAPVLKALQRRYKGQSVYLTRKGMAWTVLQSERPSDGVLTGTFYVGRKSSARVTAKVYDKQEEARVRGKLIPPRTRYEVSVKKDYGATLRDAAEPDRLFWKVAGGHLLPRPDGIGDWDPDWSQGWSAGPRPELMASEVLLRRLASSPELDLLVSIADEMSADGGQGRLWLLRKLAERFGVVIRRDSLSLAPNASEALSDASTG